MKIKNETDPKKLIRRMAEEAATQRLMLDTHNEHWKKGPYYLPGGMVKALSPEEQEVIKQLTAEHCQDVRVDGISCDTYKPTLEEEYEYNKKYGKVAKK